MGRKWQNIKYSKGKADQERGATFSSIAKDIMKAAKEGGPDPEGNIRLKTAVLSARKVNMPGENIQRAILKGSGQLEGARFEEAVYEGYGPGGVAVMLNILTDNRNRTAADVRHAFSKHGGALGETGCVGWMFGKHGIIQIDRAQTTLTEDDLMMIALEAGADDLQASEGSFEIITSPDVLDTVLRALEKEEVAVERGETTMIPTATVEVTGENAEKLIKLLEILEENDDIQNVYSNAEFGEE